MMYLSTYLSSLPLVRYKAEHISFYIFLSAAALAAAFQPFHPMPFLFHHLPPCLFGSSFSLSFWCHCNSIFLWSPPLSLKCSRKCRCIYPSYFPSLNLLLLQNFLIFCTFRHHSCSLSNILYHRVALFLHWF